MAKKYTFDFKKQVIEHYFKSNDGYGLTAWHFQVPVGTVESWVKLYKRKGIDGLKPITKPRCFSPEFKYKVVRYFIDNHLSQNQAALAFDIHFGCVGHWFKIYQKYGKAGFSMTLNPPQGKADKKMAQKVKKNSEKTKEELLEMVSDLEVEVAYLKKLDALLRQKRLEKKKSIK
ncbi:Helix-turn-helix domain-containing protein [Gilliamella bombicola]|uniref:Helix-turn-helix domain-containing protein n=1 Tax=Gilliamella bombicola TaxID=1798182 RepID=A0A1C4ATC1_9GAMM|nr:helix-turn-helix domain-containing protein [Gilliamella bombicola]SCB97843.1 Helix-turn-helix domain-containing protein [Gilliamella bombicola]